MDALLALEFGSGAPWFCGACGGFSPSTIFANNFLQLVGLFREIALGLADPLGGNVAERLLCDAPPYRFGGFFD